MRTCYGRRATQGRQPDDRQGGGGGGGGGDLVTPLVVGLATSRSVFARSAPQLSLEHSIILSTHLLSRSHRGQGVGWTKETGTLQLSVTMAKREGVYVCVCVGGGGGCCVEGGGGMDSWEKSFAC